MHPQTRYFGLILAVVVLLMVLSTAAHAEAAPDHSLQRGEAQHHNSAVRAADVPRAASMPGVQDSEEARRNYFTDLKVITNDGRELRFYSDLLKDRVVLISFFYLDCGTVCPIQNKNLSDLQNLLGDRLGKDILILSITVDPARDTPALVNAYARAWDSRPGRLFLTGSKLNVDWINYKLGGYVEDPRTHKTTFLMGNVRTGHWMTVRPDTRAAVIADNLLKLADER